MPEPLNPAFTQAAMPALSGTVHCPNCDITSPTPTDGFCPRCGWFLDQAPPAAQALGTRQALAGVVVALKVSAAESYLVKETPFLIGRDQGDLKFPEDLQLSRLHAAVLYRDGQLYVRDLDSRNGTVLGDRRLPPNEDIPVLEGERLRLGNKEFEILFKGESGGLTTYGKAYYLDSSTGVRFALRPGENIIGRGDFAHIRLNDNEAVSRQHATIRLEDQFGKFRIELQDHKSENGTQINGSRVLPQRWVVLEVGDEVQVADVVLRLVEEVA